MNAKRSTLRTAMAAVAMGSLCLSSCVVSAQTMNRSDINNLVAKSVPDNNTKAITPALVRNTLLTILNSMGVLNDTNTWSGSNGFVGPVGIGTTTPNASSVLDMTSATKGALLPRMTTAQMNAISSPALGLIIYNISNNNFEFFNGSSWVVNGSGVSGSNGQVQINSSGSFGPAPNISVNTANGALTFAYNNAGSGNFNNFYLGSTVVGPTSETRTAQVVMTTTLMQDANPAVLPWIVQNTLNPNGYVWGNGEHNSALYGYSQMYDLTPWVAGCTIGGIGAARCPGTLYTANGVNLYADNRGTGNLQHAHSGICHSPQNLNPGGEIEQWTCLHNDGAIPGFNASTATLIDNPAWWNFIGQGLSNPTAGVDAYGGDSTRSANGTIVGTTLCLDTLVIGGPILNGSVVTGTGVTAGTHLIGSAPSDIPGGRLCWTVDPSQTVADTALTLTGKYRSFLAHNFTPNAESGYYFDVTGSTPGGQPDGGFVGRYDATNTPPLGIYSAFEAGGFDYMYGIHSGTGRGGGIVAGYTSIAAVPVNDWNFNVAAKTIVADIGFTAGGNPPTRSGSCATTTPIGANTVGKFTASGPCVEGTVILTFAFAGSAYITGWTCDAHNTTTKAYKIDQTSDTTGTVTFTGTMANNDVVAFKCMSY